MAGADGGSCCRCSPDHLPIALAYRTAHYLPSLLVDGQYVLVALNDPFATGADYLGLSGFYVTTGFFNHRETMRAIWLSQAGFIVLGHVVAVILAHGAAVKIYGDVARAFRAGCRWLSSWFSIPGWACGFWRRRREVDPATRHLELDNMFAYTQT